MADQPPKPRRGCFFYGCLAGTICMVALLALALLGLHQVRRTLNRYTDTRPVQLPSVQLSAAQIEEVQRRLESFMDAARTGRPTPPLTLTADEINALIATRPDLQALKGRVYVTIENGHLKGQLSVPMDQLGLPMLKGRYLNGTGTFAMSLQNGILHIAPAEILVKGQPLPGIYMDKLRQQNLADAVNNDPHASVALNRLQDIQIQDGKIILVPKQER